MIAAAAILQDDLIYTMPPPARHHNIIRKMAASGLPIPIMGEQGFITSMGNFVDRRLARRIAEQSGQIKMKNGNPNELYSEDLW